MPLTIQPPIPTPTTTPFCFALLDDAHGETAVSRLYTGLVETLLCSEPDGWPDLFRRMCVGLNAGLHAVALLSYETGAQLQNIERYKEEVMPSRILLFESCELLDKNQVQIWLNAQVPNPVAGIASLLANVDEAAFSEAISTVRDYIAAGDTYQVNYTYRLHFHVYGSPIALYSRLRLRQPVPYGALICLPEGDAVLSLSPELFIQHHEGRLLARPMKGTAAATGNDIKDQHLAAKLATDSKNRAENLMIVDLLRNDLGRIAETGSVTVPHLFQVQRFSSVLQMTSTIEADLSPQVCLPEIMSALFPCGSITGAPKRHTMEIIRQLESEPRGLYTGAIGWFDLPLPGKTIGDFCLSVPIRTLHLNAPDQHDIRRGVMGVGAGIVYDSVASEEYAECQLKAKFLTQLPAQFELFETMHASHEAGCRHLSRHLQRLAQSARYFGFEYDENRITQALCAFCEELPPQTPFRLRLSLQFDGQFALQSGPLQALPDRVKLLVGTQASHNDAIFLQHKTSVRQQYDDGWREAERHGAFDMVFCNSQGFLTEGGRSNIFIRQGARWFTPPLADGVLPGIMRALLLEDPQLKARERQLTLADLYVADAIILCNSLRGALNAEVHPL